MLYLSGAREWGGAEVVLSHLVTHLGEGYEPVLLGVDEDVLRRIRAGRDDVRTVSVPPIRTKKDVRAILAHRRTIAGLRPDIVQVNLPMPWAEPYSILAASTVRGTRVVAVEHLPLPPASRGSVVLKRLAEPRLAAHVAVGSRTAREVERLAGLGAGRVAVIENGVPEPPAGPGMRRADGSFVIGGIGRLDEQKGFDVLLRALARMPDARAVLVGDGPARAALEALAADLGVSDRTTLTGWAEPATALLADVDVLAVPSRFEGLPLVVLEAMLAGVPVVATDVGSIADAVTDGLTGLLVPVEDDLALARALGRLRDDPELLERLASAARGRARQRFTVQAMVARYEQLYAGLLRGTDR